MPSDVVISARGLTKAYRLFGHPGDRIKQFLSLGLRQYHRKFTALQDVSFDILQGETVGIIGRNGSGKSTLLQLICGILKPTAGSVQARGRISALLELGAGFNPEFTGRENVYFQGTLMGFSRKQMDDRFDDIAAFADIGEFIDQPVRIYSSGMFVRLAFAVAIHENPEILIIDEALAVGDKAFQAKCFKRLDDIRKNGSAILIVTHALEQVAHFCTRAMLLDDGRLIANGDTSSVLKTYIDHLKLRGGVTSAAEHEINLCPIDDLIQNHPAYNLDETRWGDRAATIYDIKITQDGRENSKVLVPGISVRLEYCVHFHTDIEQPIYGLAIKTPEGAILLGTNSRQLCGLSGIPRQKINDRVRVCFTFRPYLDYGDYLVSLGIASEMPTGIQPHDRRYDSLLIRIAKPISPTGDIEMDPSFHIVEEP